MITAERLKELKQQGALVWYADKKLHRINLSCCLIGETQLERKVQTITYKYPFISLFETENKKEAEHDAKYGDITRIEKMPVPPTWEETKIEDFIKSNKTKPDNYKELFAFYLNNELFNLEIYSDENCKYFITISDDKNYYKPLFKMPLTKDNYYKALDKMVELWREEE